MKCEPAANDGAVGGEELTRHHFTLIGATFALAIASVSCTKKLSGEADESPSAVKKRGLEEPDTIPGYLIDERSFGYTNREQWLSDIVLTPFLSIQAERSYVVSLEKPATAEYVVALYGPPADVTCADFVAGLEQRGGPSATVDPDFRFSMAAAENMELSSDGMTLTIFAPAAAPRLACTALVVATALPQNAGYKPYYGRLAFLLTSGVPSGSFLQAVSYVAFARNESGTWQTERVSSDYAIIEGYYNTYLALAKIPGDSAFIAGLPQGQVFERHDGTWAKNDSYQRGFSVELKTGIVGFASPAEDEIWAVEGVGLSVLPYMTARKRTGVMGTFTTSSFAGANKQLIGVSLNEQGLLSGFETESSTILGVRLHDVTAGGAVVAVSDRYCYSPSPGGPDTHIRANSLNTHVSANGVAYFAARCQQSGYEGLPASLNLGRLDADGREDWITLIASGNLNGAESAVRPAMDVDAAGTAHLLYHYNTAAEGAPKLLYIGVSAGDAVSQDVVELATMNGSLGQVSAVGQPLRVKSEPGGNLHVVVYISEGAAGQAPYHGVYAPGSGRVMLKRVGENTKMPDVSPLIIY